VADRSETRRSLSTSVRWNLEGSTADSASLS
jgi:hypothetical protein